MNWALRISFSLLALVLFSCRKEKSDRCFVGRGETISEIRQLSPYNALEINGRVNVELIADTSNWVEVIYGNEIIGSIETELDAQTLSIIENSHCDWIRKVDPKPHVKVHYTNLNSIRFEGNDSLFCNDTIYSDTFNLDVFFVVGNIKLNVKSNQLSVNNHSGATEIELFGKTDVLKYYTASNAPQNASLLQTRIADVTTDAQNDLYINASEILYYQIFDVGNIYLTGTQNIEKWHDSGKGAVIFQ